MKVLITGGGGFIGSALIRHITRHTNWQIVNLDKLTYAANPAAVEEAQGDPRYCLEEADICDGPAIARLFAHHRPDGVIHLAAESHVDRSISSPGQFILTNLVGTYQLLEVALRYWQELDAAAKARFRFHHVSTDEVFGSLQEEDPAFCETTRYDPTTPYSASKAGSDHLVRAWHHTFGLPVVLTNCSNNYGPWQFPEKLIPLMITHAIQGKPLPVYGQGLNIRDWLHVEDHAEAIWRVFTAAGPGASYCIGGDAEWRNIEVVKAICTLLDEMMPDSQYRPHAQLITYVRDRLGHDFRYAMDSRLIRAELNWQPRYSFPEGLRQTVKWYLNHREFWEKPHSHLETA